ncbi:zinc finger protein-like, partial [Tropilaelaps mercedesae]
CGARFMSTVQALLELEEKRFRCSHCPYQTNDVGNFRRHELIHSGTKPFKCVLCDFRSAWRKSIKSHMINVHKTLE